MSGSTSAGSSAPPVWEGGALRQLLPLASSVSYGAGGKITESMM